MHIDKFTRSASVRMNNHYERTPDDYVQRSNENIDSSRTHLNYNSAPEHGKGDVFIRDMLSREDVYVYGGNRKDLNVMCTCIVNAPKELPKEQQKRFFQVAYRFLAERYGRNDNIVSAYVHMDETTPHMHFAFIPLVSAKTKQLEKGYKYRLCAKEVVNRQDLQTLHYDMQRCINLHLGAGFKILTGKTTVSKSMVEFKKEKLQHDLEKVIAVQKELEKVHGKAPIKRISREPAFKKVLGIATEDDSMCSVKRADLNWLEKRLQEYENEKSGIKNLYQIGQVLNGSAIQDLKSENQKLRSYVKQALDIIEKKKGIEKALKVAQDMLQPHDRRAFSLALRDIDSVSVAKVTAIKDRISEQGQWLNSVKNSMKVLQNALNIAISRSSGDKKIEFQAMQSTCTAVLKRCIAIQRRGEASKLSTGGMSSTPSIQAGQTASKTISVGLKLLHYLEHMPAGVNLRADVKKDGIVQEMEHQHRQEWEIDLD